MAEILRHKCTQTRTHTQKHRGLPLHSAHGACAAVLRHAINKYVRIDTHLNRRCLRWCKEKREYRSPVQGIVSVFILFCTMKTIHCFTKPALHLNKRNKSLFCTKAVKHHPNAHLSTPLSAELLCHNPVEEVNPSVCYSGRR